MRSAAPDPARVTSQSSLATSTGRPWLIWGAALTFIALAVLGVLAATRVPAAWAACAVIAILYLSMVVVRFTVAARRARLLALAWLMGVTAAVALVSVVLVGVVSATAVSR